MPNVIRFYVEAGLVGSLFLGLADAEDADVVVQVEAGFGGNRAGFGWPPSSRNCRPARSWCIGQFFLASS